MVQPYLVAICVCGQFLGRHLVGWLFRDGWRRTRHLVYRRVGPLDAELLDALGFHLRALRVLGMQRPAVLFLHFASQRLGPPAAPEVVEGDDERNTGGRSDDGACYPGVPFWRRISQRTCCCCTTGWVTYRQRTPETTVRLTRRTGLSMLEVRPPSMSMSRKSSAASMSL